MATNNKKEIDMRARYCDEYDEQDAKYDEYIDSCETIFCLNTMEMFRAFNAYDELVCECCKDTKFVLEEDIKLLIDTRKNHVARKDHDDLIKAGDTYESAYFRIVYLDEDGDKQAYADSWKRLIKKGKK